MAGKPAATVGSNHVCPMCTGTTPHVGGPIAQGSPNVFFNGKPAATIGSMCTCVGPPDTIVTGNPTVLINGKAVACVGDMSAHGGTIVVGEPNITIGSKTPDTPRSVMPLDKISFPKITPINRVQAAAVGQGKNLKTAEKTQEKIKKLAEKQEEETEKQEEKKLPKLQGEIIFVHGYLSAPKQNSESHYNAIADKNPDKNDSGALQGENANEHNHTDEKDIYTAKEQQERANRTKGQKLWEDEISKRIGRPFFQKFSYDPDEKYVGYWNSKANDNKATETYANYFNAEGRVHYINGSHGLGSSGAHRIDHGISLGYEWARYNWNIYEKKNVDIKKEEKPEIQSHTPQYKPITIVGHSQGVCMAAGVKLGVIKYAHEMGYDKVAINAIFLGVHQPTGLFGEDYDSLIKQKVKQYMVNQSVLYFGKEEDSGIKFLNSISDLYNPKYKKLYNERGFIEHVKEICGNWSAYKSRAVQFTFSNDRGDLVTLDGDIPEIKSACHPKRDSTLFSAEYFHKETSIPAHYTTDQNKKIINLKTLGAEGGFLVLPPYIVNRRFDFEDIDKESTKKEQQFGKEWKPYETVAIRWAKAMHAFITAKKKIRKRL